MAKKIVLLMGLSLYIISISFAQTSGNGTSVKTTNADIKSKTSKSGGNSSGSSKSSSSSSSHSSSSQKKSTRGSSGSSSNTTNMFGDNASTLFPSFIDDSKTTKSTLGNFMENKDYFSSLFGSNKGTNIFPEISKTNSNGTSSKISSSFSSISSSSIGTEGTSLEHSNSTSKPAHHNMYKARENGPFYQNSSSFSQISNYSLNNILGKYSIPDKSSNNYSKSIVDTSQGSGYMPNLRYYNLPNSIH